MELVESWEELPWERVGELNGTMERWNEKRMDKIVGKEERNFPWSQHLT